MINAVKDKLDKLVFNFKLANYRTLNESQTRLSYIDKFWEALGWNVSNTDEVRVETTDKQSKRPDYRFLKGNKTLFFVEAKKPAEDLKNPKHIFQTKIYCWNGKVPLAILTDFEEFRPFRSLGKPKFEDANKGIIKKFDLLFESYPDMAYDLLNTFGREAVLGGSLNDLVVPTQIELRDTVDKDFLNTLTKWRTDLATQIAKSNKFKNEFELSEAVQRILDRLVFLRILQDRDIENEDFMCEILGRSNPSLPSPRGNKLETPPCPPQGEGSERTSGSNSLPLGRVGVGFEGRGGVEPYQAFLKICKELAPKYNGLIFNPHPLSENLKIEGSLFKKIVRELDFENSLYRFDEIPVEMLGTTYERFLGDEISLDKKGKVIIDQKPEVRKAGGVYYTPQYIVEYIVQNTVGKLLENCKTPADVAKLKILDPACGSGSFLLGAFDALIKWHEDYFSANPLKIIEFTGKQNYKLAYLDDANKTRLTARMKGRILKNNLFGVDLDKQATEVTQMSLYIKVLEGMANEGLYVLGFQDAILPKLEDNIKCGNSLIGSDFVSDDFFGLSEREKHKINPFDWVDNFPFIKETGGFDAVIGNPPYGAELDGQSMKFLQDHYKIGSTDTAALFMVKAQKLLKDYGINGFIIPKAFTFASNWEKTREIILPDINIIVDCNKVWKEVKLEMSICISQNNSNTNQFTSSIRYKSSILEIGTIDKELCKEFGFILNGLTEKEILIGQKIIKTTTNLNNHVINRRGLILNKFEENAEFKVIGCKEIGRFILRDIRGLINENLLGTNAEIRPNHILLQGIVAHIENPVDHIKIMATIIEDFNNIFIADNINQLIVTTNISNKFILGIINSFLMSWYCYRFLYGKSIRTMRIDNPITSRIPFPVINLNNKSEKAQHDKMVELVERMLDLHKKRQTANEFDRKHIDQYIALTNKEIDELVYKLYDLTEEEIKVVEGEK